MGRRAVGGVLWPRFLRTPAIRGGAAATARVDVSGADSSRRRLRRTRVSAARRFGGGVGAVEFLAGPGSDSVLVVLGLSMPNRALAFRRDERGFLAIYAVEAVIRSGSAVRTISATDQRVRVPVFAETQRAEETVLFQQSTLMPPGDGVLTVAVIDQVSAKVARAQMQLHVPRLSPTALSIVPFYRGSGRDRRGANLDLVVNPKATIQVGTDTLNLYVEEYGATPADTVRLRAVDQWGVEVWQAALATSGEGDLRAGVARLPPGTLPPGWLSIEGVGPRVADTVRKAVLVGYADRWVVADADGILALLRYYGHNARVGEMLTARGARREALWNRLWTDTDPVPETETNERMAEYFSRLRVANELFREGNQPGWLTDRGEVYLTLGPPDEEFPVGPDFTAQRIVNPTSCRLQGCPAVAWRYSKVPISVVFVYDLDLARYRLEVSSRREFRLMQNRTPD